MKWLRTLRDRFSRSIQVRLTCYFILILLPLILFSLYANMQSQRILEQELGERTMSGMDSALEYVDQTLQSLEQLSTMLATDGSLTSRLKHQSPELTPETLVDFTAVMSYISNVNAVNPILSGVSIYHGGTSKLISSRVGLLDRPPHAIEEWYDEFVETGRSIVLYNPTRHEEALMGWADPIYNESQLLLMQLMDLYSRDRGNNVLMLSLPKRTLLSNISHLAPSQASHVSLYDDRGRLLVSSSGAAEPLLEQEIPASEVSVAQLPGRAEKQMMLRTVSPRSGWSLVLEQPEREIYKKSRPLQIFTYWIILISCLLAVWIAWLIYSSIAAPVSSLVSGMRQLRLGNLDTKLVHHRQDELGYLTDAFNQTAEQQRHLIQDIYEQQLRLTKTELKFLQSQINPHFLYNTLDSIYWSAKNYDAEEISEMVLNLSRFFRLSLSRGRETFTVEETFTHLNYYIRVQQLRFVGQFTVSFDADPQAANLYVLKLILQPLVENAILHGLEKQKGGGQLAISARLESDRLLLTVSDNGKGMEEQRLRQIHDALAGAENMQASGAERKDEFFGLLNVASRIRLYYGESAMLRIASETGGGTSAVLDLPRALCSSEQEGDLV
ncbi:cache domain-containing sensor histidine kinase [Paenibacillus sp. 1P07SE]|uniref:cache domain-containing sensor histidine kinase n=1 Tax=Paenibacillus sp. 1P07SE TaxID=3132209 RepID=UPI0039A60809